MTMELVINTSSHNFISVSLRKGKRSIAESSVVVEHSHGEKLLPLVNAVITKFRSQGKVTSISVSDTGEGFSSLRIGVSVANALSYALGIPVKTLAVKAGKARQGSIVVPRYAYPPKIGKK